MRIGMMADLYTPHISGVTIYISLNKRYLENAGHEVFVFTFGDLEYQDNEQNVIRSPGVPIGGSTLYLTLRHNRHAQRLLKSMDIIHVHHPVISGQLAVRYANSFGIPIIFTNHTRYDLYAQIYTPMLPDVIGESVVRAYIPFFCNECDLVIAPSPSLRDLLISYGVKSTVEIIPNGVDIKPFQAALNPVSRQELGFSDDTILFTYMGRLGPEKNLPFLLRAFGGVVSAFKRVGLVFIGEGPAREELEDRVRLMGLTNQVYFTGLIPYENLPRYLAAADAFVSASVTEVHPLSVIEAMATGLPVVGIRSPGVGDIIENGKTGILAPMEELAAFTAAIARMASEHDLRKAMGKQAYQAAGAYAIERTAQIVMDHYEQVVVAKPKKKKSPFARKHTSSIGRQDKH